MRSRVARAAQHTAAPSAPARRRAPAAAGAAAALAALASCAPPPAVGLVIHAPTRLSRAVTSDDQVLCDRLRVHLTFDRVDDVGPPPVDRVELEPKEGVACTWVLADEAELQRGTYDLVVRFTTKETAAACRGPTLVGAYVRRDLAFPFAEDFEGLTDADFQSRPGEEGPLEEAGLSFDPDGDGRDNLAETAVGSDPCQENSVPVASLELPATGDEATVMTLRVSTSDADQVDHRVVLRIAHGYDLADRPEYQTTEIVYAARTADPESPVVTPGTAERPERERWSVASRVISSAAGAAVWEVDFTPDEPFVAALQLELQVDDGYGNPLGEPQRASCEVAGVDDPPALLFETDSGEAPASELSFAEAGNPATVHRFRFQDDDLDPGSDASQWRPRLVAPAVPALSLTQDVGYWALAWEPSNAEALAEPAAGYAATIEFLDPNDYVFDQADLSLLVDPLWNNGPELEPPATGELSLPAGDGWTHSIYFDLRDPDQVTTAPTCTVQITPDSGTACTAPFASVRCEQWQPRDGELWAFQVVLVAAADYTAACGEAPRFTAEISVTDTPPAGAANGAATAATQASCGEVGCVEHWQLRTAEVVSGALVSGGPGAAAGDDFPSPAVVLGSAPAAVVHVMQQDGTYAALLLDLSFPAPEHAYRFAGTDLCKLRDGRPHEIGVADEVNGRLLVIGQQRDGSYCNGARVVALVTPTNPAAPQVTVHLEADVCAATSNPGNPVVDSVGNIYLPCESEPGKLVRVDAAGALATAPVDLLSNSCNCMDNDANAVVEDPQGTQWLVWPDLDGILVIDLSTFDQATPTVHRVDMGAGWDPDDISDHAVDTARYGYLFLKQTTGDAELWRLVFGAAAPPAVEGPLVLSGNGGERLALRRPGPEPPSGVDLVVESTSSYDPRPYVDLDTFEVVESRPSSDFYVSSSPGLFPSPDRRYFVAPTTSAHEDSYIKGVYLYSWEPGAARRLLDLGLPDGEFSDPDVVTVSMAGNLMVYSGEVPIAVIYFRDAAQGLD